MARDGRARGPFMYVQTPFPNIAYALDLDNDARIFLKYEVKQDPAVIGVMCCDTVNRGVAYAAGMIFVNQTDTTLVAVEDDDPESALGWAAALANSEASKSTHRRTPESVLDQLADSILVAGNELQQLVLQPGRSQPARNRVVEAIEVAKEALQLLGLGL
jgi:glucose dehydrogenase